MSEVLPSSSSYKGMSKFPDGLKATETATWPCCLFKCEMAKEAMESEKGLEGTIHGVCLELEEEQMGSSVWKIAAIGV